MQVEAGHVILAVLLVLGVVLGFGLVRVIRAYRRAATVEREAAERILAYKALRGWGEYSDPQREAFINGWLDQCFKPALAAFPADAPEDEIVAYQSGWVWSRDRDQMMPNGRVEDVTEWRDS